MRAQQILMELSYHCLFFVENAKYEHKQHYYKI